MFRLTLLLILSLLSTRVYAADSAPNKTAVLTTPDAPRIQGIWKSVEPEMIAKNLYATREIQFTLSRWEEIIFFAQDSSMKKMVLIYRAEGPYDLKKAVDGPWQLDLKTSRRALNLQQAKNASLGPLQAGGCALNRKSEVDISSSGCGVFPSLAKCATEFEVVEMKDGKLSMGDHAANHFNCDESKRPQKSGAPMKRVN